MDAKEVCMEARTDRQAGGQRKKRTNGRTDSGVPCHAEETTQHYDFTDRTRLGCGRAPSTK